MSEEPGKERNAVRFGPAAKVLLWDYSRESLAYDLALLVVLLVLLLVPGGFWGDPLWAL
jgi:hypothetical protein